MSSRNQVIPELERCPDCGGNGCSICHETGRWRASHSGTAATRLREIADRTEREADYEDDGYAAHELREEAMFLRETADLLARNRKLWLALECAADLLGNDGYADDPDYRQEWKQISEALQDA